MSSIDTASFAPDLLPVAVQIVKLISANCDLVELLQQAEPGEFADGMRKCVDADAEFAVRFGLLQQCSFDAASPQHCRGGKATNTTPHDNHLHQHESTQGYPLMPKVA